MAPCFLRFPAPIGWGRILGEWHAAGDRPLVGTGVQGEEAPSREDPGVTCDAIGGRSWSEPARCGRTAVPMRPAPHCRGDTETSAPEPPARGREERGGSDAALHVHYLWPVTRTVGRSRRGRGGA